MTVYHVYALVAIFAVLAASIWLAWYLDRKKAITNLQLQRHIGWSAIERSPTPQHRELQQAWCTYCPRRWWALPHARHPAKTYEHGIKERTRSD